MLIYGLFKQLPGFLNIKKKPSALNHIIPTNIKIDSMKEIAFLKEVRLLLFISEVTERKINWYDIKMNLM